MMRGRRRSKRTLPEILIKSLCITEVIDGGGMGKRWWNIEMEFFYGNGWGMGVGMVLRLKGTVRYKLVSFRSVDGFFL